MTEYLCLTLLSNSDEVEAAFKARLATFWTHMLRNKLAEYERVYAEATRFGSAEGRVARQYMAEVEVIEALTAELAARGITVAPVDHDDIYSKYEASGSDWFQIEH